MNGRAGVVLNCRTCTRACKQYRDLQDQIELGPSEGTNTLAGMLEFCSGLSFDPQDGAAMPQHICLACMQQLGQAFTFKRMVIDSDELLRLGLYEAPPPPPPAAADTPPRPRTAHIRQLKPVPGTEEFVIEMLEEAEPDQVRCSPSACPRHQTNAAATQIHEADAVGVHRLGAMVEMAPEEEEYVIEEELTVVKPGEVKEIDEDDDGDGDGEGEVEVEVEEHHLMMEYVQEFQAADVEYVTEYAALVAQEEEIEVMDESAVGGAIIESQVIVIPSEGAMDEVIGEENDLEMDENMAEEEHLLTEEDDFVEESVDSVPTSTNDAMPRVCTICNKGFRQQCRLNQHMRSHVEEKHYECEECGKRLKHLRNYKEHILTHTNLKPHQCNICLRFYRTTSSLAAHKRTHAEEKPHNCDVCGRGYAAYDHLRRHKLTHTGERPFACDQCDKAYYDSSSLRQHKISHTGEKAYTCEICGVGLSQKSGYKKHLLVHSGAKPHMCKICGRSFTFTSNLNAHVRLHTGEKPFKCDLCPKAFPTKKRLNSHLRVHNKDRSEVMAT
ncbi:hypothetical protein KR018_002592, partial [Drosophila ironensis]